DDHGVSTYLGHHRRAAVAGTGNLGARAALEIDSAGSEGLAVFSRHVFRFLVSHVPRALGSVRAVAVVTVPHGDDRRGRRNLTRLRRRQKLARDWPVRER